jgi:hypothetical protein
MKAQLDETKEKLKQSLEDYSAATFTRERFVRFCFFLLLTSSKNGRSLMSRIRLLQRENEALGQQLDTGKIHKLEVELEVCKGIRRCVNVNESNHCRNYYFSE